MRVASLKIRRADISHFAPSEQSQCHSTAFCCQLNFTQISRAKQNGLKSFWSLVPGCPAQQKRPLFFIYFQQRIQCLYISTLLGKNCQGSGVLGSSGCVKPYVLGQLLTPYVRRHQRDAALKRNVDPSTQSSTFLTPRPVFPAAGADFRAGPESLHHHGTRRS